MTYKAILYFLSVDIKIGGGVVNRSVGVRMSVNTAESPPILVFADTVSFKATQRSFAAEKKKTGTASGARSSFAAAGVADVPASKKRKREPEVQYSSPSPSVSSPESTSGPTTPDSGSSAVSVTVVPGDLNVDGTARARAFLQYSDIRLKTNVEDLVGALDTISKLQGVSYRWKPGASAPNSTGGLKVIGLIAQDVEKVLPELVRRDKDGWLSVAYVEIIPILIEACKDLLGSVKATAADVQLLGSKVEALSRAVAKNSSEGAVSLSQLKSLQAQIDALKRRQRRQVKICGANCWLLVGISAVVTAVVLAIILGAVFGSRTSGPSPAGSPSASPPGGPTMAPQPGTALCDDCNSLFAFDVGPWSGNQLLNPSFEDLNPTDPTRALGWEASEPAYPYKLHTGGSPTPLDGTTAVNVSSYGCSYCFLSRRTAAVLTVRREWSVHWS